MGWIPQVRSRRRPGQRGQSQSTWWCRVIAWSAPTLPLPRNANGKVQKPQLRER